MNTTFQRIATLLEARCGFDPAVQSDRLRAFLAGRSLHEQNDLAEAGEQDPSWQALLEAMLVHETYFYRHPEQLEVLARRVIPRLMDRPLRVWCAGCSTGEEAYTLAFLLRDARCPARILATDISHASIATARSGRYREQPGLNSFRAMPAAAWRYFQASTTEPDTWQVGACVRDTVDFAVHNLMTPHPSGFAADLIVCRNILMYFGRSGLRQAESMLTAAARPGTVLLLGPAERLPAASIFRPMTDAHPQILHWPP